MKKKLQIVSLLFLLLTSVLSAQSFTVGNFNYTVLSGTNVSLTGYVTNPTGSLIISGTVIDAGTTYTVTSIGTLALASTGLVSVTIPNSVTHIGDLAFYRCFGLISVSIPNSVISIGNSAFQSCTSLTSLSIPNSVTSISIGAFNGCSGLTSLSIGNSITSIGVDVFKSCSGLTSLNIPNTVTSIGEGAFSNCSGLTSLNIPNSVTSIGDGAFFSCSGLTSLSIPNSVTSISISAFGYCSGLTSLSIPNSVTSIGSNAFNFCTGLTSLSIPNSVTTIGNQSFLGCTGLTSLSIPNSVTSIIGTAFSSCTGLTSVNVSWATPLVITPNVFLTLSLNTIDLNVPTGTSALYKAAAVWKDFKSINDATLSTDSYSLNNNLQLYPNPAKEYVSISGLEDQENYSIYSILGTKMSAGSIAKDQKIDTQNLAPGTYFIKFEKGNSLKFIKE